MFELPFSPSEAFGDAPPELVRELLAFLRDTQELLERNGTFYWLQDRYPADGVGLRGAGGPQVSLVVEAGQTALTIGTVDRPSAPWMVHPGAIYLHAGASYRVRELDMERNRAVLEAFPTDAVTEPQTRTTFASAGPSTCRVAPGGTLHVGELVVTREVTGFKTVDLFTREVRAVSPLAMDPSELHTEGAWLALADDAVVRLRELGLWSNDGNDYGPRWPQIRAAVRLRDGHACRVCGARETNGPHDVHHVRPFRSFASREDANRMDNLVTLCKPCHRRAEDAVRIRSGLAGVSHALRHLAPLFLMCDGGDIAVTADPSSPLSEGRPALVAFDQVSGGVGLARHLAERFEEVAAAARDVVAECACEQGCPACVGPPGEMGVSGKAEAAALLGVLAP